MERGRSRRGRPKLIGKDMSLYVEMRIEKGRSKSTDGRQEFYKNLEDHMIFTLESKCKQDQD